MAKSPESIQQEAQSFIATLIEESGLTEEAKAEHLTDYSQSINELFQIEVESTDVKFTSAERSNMAKDIRLIT